MRPHKMSFLNDEPCMIRPSYSDLNPVYLKYYPFMVSLNKYNGSFNVLLPKICFEKKKNTYMFQYLIW